jgi:hypothetical protein
MGHCRYDSYSVITAYEADYGRLTTKEMAAQGVVIERQP